MKFMINIHKENAEREGKKMEIKPIAVNLVNIKTKTGFYQVYEDFDGNVYLKQIGSKGY